ncbi:UNKNOWN [Stylonychia lemnae]|uniref:Small-conductance calcium-activated potassium channel protein n=1 Tax=Stylonychia lemnae TaxID=5949 RepID=A0A078A5D9_STYLE|nr:UNKNOWN [Stylonychia lemnae]|eukprot:CDW77384.1 UNKNOWN [Stylonychia lemnae]
MLGSEIQLNIPTSLDQSVSQQNQSFISATDQDLLPSQKDVISLRQYQIDTFQNISQIIDKDESPNKNLQDNQLNNTNGGGRNPFKLLGLLNETEKRGSTFFGSSIKKEGTRSYMLKSKPPKEKLSRKERIKQFLLNLLPRGLKSLKNVNDKDQYNVYNIVKKREILKAKIMLNHIAGAVFGLGHGWLQFNENRIYEESQLKSFQGVLTKVSDSKQSQIFIMRVTGMIIAAFLVFSVVKHYQYDLQMKKIINGGFSYPSIWNPDYKIFLVIEIVICCVFIPPGLNGILTFNTNGGTVSYSVDMIFTSLTLFKGYLVTRVYQHISIWTNYEAKRISNRLGVQTDEIFGLKSDINNYNFMGLLLVATALIIYISAFLFGFERNYYNSELTDIHWYEFMRFYINQVWLQIETFFGVGYGEGYPATIPGRTIIIISCLGSQYLLSILVCIVFSWAKFRPQEASAYQILLQKTNKYRAQESAKDVIVQALRLKKFQYQVYSPNRYLHKMRRKLAKKIEQTKQLAAQVPKLTEKMQKLREQNKQNSKKLKTIADMSENVMEFFIQQNNTIMRSQLKKQIARN